MGQGRKGEERSQYRRIDIFPLLALSNQKARVVPGPPALKRDAAHARDIDPHNTESTISAAIGLGLRRLKTSQR